MKKIFAILPVIASVGVLTNCVTNIEIPPTTYEEYLARLSSSEASSSSSLTLPSSSSFSSSSFASSSSALSSSSSFVSSSSNPISSSSSLAGSSSSVGTGGLYCKLANGSCFTVSNEATCDDFKGTIVSSCPGN